MQFRLNDSNDAGALAAEYAAKGRLQVRDVFEQATAKEIHSRLSAIDWWLAFNEGEKVHQLQPQELRSLSRERATQIQAQINADAAKGYQFLYNYFPLFTAYFSPNFPAMPLFPVYEFLNSERFLGFARELTGLDNIRWADGQATLYRATHFLKVHTDQVDKEQRLAAYVLNFTENWDTDWGGLLQFWDKNGDVEHAFKPSFNALNIFTIPADHSVSMVTPYSPGLRFSITGWLRGDEPPGSFPAR
jgi:Rps23 Pro-64 3,4-dihydroxylase Tpa1-like proline 4-hydroxylase